LRFAPVIVDGIVTVTLEEPVAVDGDGVVLDVRVGDDEVPLAPVGAVRLLDGVVIGGVVEMLDGAGVVVAVDPALAVCVAPVAAAEFVTVGVALPEVVVSVAVAGSLTDDRIGPLVGGGVVVELHAASESVTAAASPAR
jgi:hypothetical protein